MTDHPKTQPADVLKFWFGHSSLSEPAEETRVKHWFASSEQFDQEIAERFSPTIEAAINGELTEWRDAIEGQLALILLCDQFTRNVYRKQARAFAGDPLALEISQTAIVSGSDRALGIQQRAFLGMPLEHCESPEVQTQSVAYFERLRQDHPDGAAGKQAESFYRFAVAHQRVIEQFGRYPHRNSALNRTSTVEEQQWLDAGGGF